MEILVTTLNSAQEERREIVQNIHDIERDEREKEDTNQ